MSNYGAPSATETMRWTPRIIGKENRVVAQIVRNNGMATKIVMNHDVAAGIVRQDCFGDDEVA